jgi:ATP-dependent DNA helicase RecG
MTTELDKAPCQTLHGVGPRLSALLAKRSIYTLQDVLFHLPFRYLDRTHLTPLRDARAGDYVAIEGVIESHRVSRGPKGSLICEFSDASGYIILRFFHFNAEQMRHLSVGTRLRCFGEVRYGYQGLEIIHPEYLPLTPGKALEVDEHLTPIYPTTEGVSQWQWRRLSDQVLELLTQGALLSDHLLHLQDKFSLPSLSVALHYVHRPPPDADRKQLLAGVHPMQQRLALEELLAHQIGLSRLRASFQAMAAPRLNGAERLTHEFLAQLPFTLTTAQKKVLTEIRIDVERSEPMLRLLQGDVGSGKTVVAALSLLKAVANGYQGALMAPTEILAEQHYHNLTQWFSSLGLTVAWLSGKIKGKTRKETLETIKAGNAHITIGTHALFQEAVQFKNLAVLVIDEQHRFGVDQRLALRQKGLQQDFNPHQLIMTATPIPRTLAMSVYAHLDHSIIDELPPGRKPIQTIVLANDKRDKVVERVKEQCVAGRQAYWICPLIEDSEKLQCEAAAKTYQQLSAQMPNLKIGLAHGALATNDKTAVMQAFKKGDIDLLVATTVVEVGVDVPNASLMIIENAERMGLSQLHQLRGRVGRGGTESFCVLLYQAPLSDTAYQRLEVMRSTESGFIIAEKDLALRGSGELLGTRQTGLGRLRIASYTRDSALLPVVKEIAQTLLRDNPLVCDALITRWLAEGLEYGQV